MSQDIVVGSCPICRRNVYFMETHYVDSGIDFHASCYIKHLCIVKNKLDNKKVKGTITLDEAHILEDTDRILINVMSDREDIKTKHILERKYDDLVCKPLIREDFKRSNLEYKIKLLEEERAQRWAFECFNVVDTQFKIGSGEEHKQLSEGD